jgi:DNA-damage-inducible protein D
MELQMSLEITKASPFEAIKKEEDGVECWYARDMMEQLGYKTWQKFEAALERAIKSCRNSGMRPGEHFAQVERIVKIGSGAERTVIDYKMSRHACYVLAMNGDPEKTQVAIAQGYFAAKTRQAEKLQAALVAIEDQDVQTILEKLNGIHAEMERISDEYEKRGFNKAVQKMIGGVPVKNLVWTKE